MVDAMKKIVILNAVLSTDERKLLSVAYKNSIGPRLDSLRIIRSLEQKGLYNTEVTKGYRLEIENELSGLCNEVLEMLDKYLIPSVLSSEKGVTGETSVFYLKMKGDFYHYLAELDKTGNQDKAQEAYKKATEISADALSAVNPLRLDLALRYSILYREIMNKKDMAIKVARKAYFDAISELDSLPEDSYKESTFTLQLIRDNITRWAEGVDV